MKISEDEINKIARLAKLDLDRLDVPALGQDLSNILSFVEMMSAADTTDVEPLSSPVEKASNLRPDTSVASIDRDVFQSIAPATEAGLYLVPKVIE